MTDEVAELVLDDNRAQTLALTIARRQALPMVNVHARYLDLLEAEGWLDRALEFLPTDKQIAERQATGAGPAGARVRRADRLHEERQRRRDPHDRPARRPGCSRRDLSTTSRRRCATRSADDDPQPPAAPGDHHHPARQPDGQPVGHLVRPPHDRGHRRVGRRRDPGLGRGPRDLRLRRVCGTRSTRCRRRRARRPARPVPRLPADGRALLAVAPAPPPPAARHRRRGRRVPRPASSGARRRSSRCLVGAHGRRRALDRGVAARGRRAGATSPSGPACGRCCTPGSTSSSSPRRTTGDAGDVARHLLGDVRPARPDVAVGRHRRAAAVRPVADPGPVGAPRRPADRAGRADRRRSSTAPAATVDAWIERQRALGGAGAGDVHRDPPRRAVSTSRRSRSRCASCATSRSTSRDRAASDRRPPG